MNDCENNIKNLPSSINEFQANIGIIFKNDRFLKESLTHRSYLNENADWPYEHNERLEFLGDAVLELAVTKYLFNAFPKSEEGELTIVRAALVNTKMLAKIAEEINLHEYLFLSKGERLQTGGKATEAVLANALEAVIGAIYLDLGYGAAEQFVKKQIISRINDAKKQGFKDPKSVLQEKIQEKIKITPSYRVIKERGGEKDKIFEVGVYFNEKIIASGTGPSKQEAEIEAAKKALDIFKNNFSVKYK